MDVGAQGYLPDLSFSEREAGDGIGGSHIIFPWFGYFRPNEKRDFLRGFQIEPSVRQRSRPDKNAKSTAGFGLDFKKEVRRWQGTRVSLACHGEMLPSADKFVEIDNSVKDKWGSPVLKINYKWDDNDLNMFKYVQKTYEEIFTAAKAVDVRLQAGIERFRVGRVERQFLCRRGARVDQAEVVVRRAGVLSLQRQIISS